MGNLRRPPEAASQLRGIPPRGPAFRGLLQSATSNGTNGTKWNWNRKFLARTANSKADRPEKWERVGENGKAAENLCPTFPSPRLCSGLPASTPLGRVNIGTRRIRTRTGGGLVPAAENERGPVSLQCGRVNGNLPFTLCRAPVDRPTSGRQVWTLMRSTMPAMSSGVSSSLSSSST